MRYFYLIFLVSLLTISCRKDYFESETDNMIFVPVLLNTEIVSHTSRFITFNLDVSVCDSNTLVAPDASEFKLFSSLSYNYKIISVNDVVPQIRDNFCTTLLVDQSGSYLPDDFDNVRFKAFNAFYRTIGNGNSFILSTFAEGGLTENDSCKVYWNKFISDYEDDKVADLLNLSTLTGGKSCLYDALYTMTNYMYEKGNGTNRSIVAFIHNPDAVSRHTMSEVISNAVSKNIRINIVWLGKGYDSKFDASVLTQIPVKTGGFSIFCVDLSTLSAFLTLSKMLRNDITAKRFQIRFNSITTDINPGFNFMGVAGVTGFLLPCYFYLFI